MKMETKEMNLTETQQATLFEMMADLGDLKKIEADIETRWSELREALMDAQRKRINKDIEICEYLEDIKLEECEFQPGEKYYIDHPDFDLCKIENRRAYKGGEIMIVFKPRRKETRGWLGKSFQVNMKGFAEMNPRMA